MAEKYSFFRGREYLANESEVGDNDHVAVISSADENVNGTVVASKNAQGLRIKVYSGDVHNKLVQYFIDRDVWVTEEILQHGEVVVLEQSDEKFVTRYTIGEAESNSGKSYLEVDVAKMRHNVNTLDREM